MVCPMPRYSVNSFTLSNAFSKKLRCHVTALPLSTSFFPYCFALRYVTMGVLIWLFLSAKGLSGIDRISPLTFLFCFFLFFFCFLLFFFIPVWFLLSPAPRRGDLLSHISCKTPLPPGSIPSHWRGAVSIFLFLRLRLTAFPADIFLSACLPTGFPHMRMPFVSGSFFRQSLSLIS